MLLVRLPQMCKAYNSFVLQFLTERTRRMFHLSLVYLCCRPPPVKVGACRTLAQLLPESDQDLIQPNVMGILSSLVDLLRQVVFCVNNYLSLFFIRHDLMEFLQASDETLHLVLETLQSAIKSGLSACLSIHFLAKRCRMMYWHFAFWAGNFPYDNVGGDQSTLIEPIISPIILDVWAQHISDPFISIDAIEVLEVCSRQNWIVPHPSTFFLFNWLFTYVYYLKSHFIFTRCFWEPFCL